ncbi:MAG: hypothetical protein KDC38_18785, partial [Planctomycetes bacterium]|nr:hypothetical protein [Planctomycetota bacterium]
LPVECTLRWSLASRSLGARPAIEGEGRRVSGAPLLPGEAFVVSGWMDGPAGGPWPLVEQLEMECLLPPASDLSARTQP